MKYFQLSILFLFLFSSLSYADNVNMKLLGADDSGEKLNTQLINNTIADLSAKGGGTLYFPAGKYLTGAIKLKSNITIELESGATLLFSDNFDDYLPFVDMRYEGVMMKSFSPLLYAVEEENITIKGRGTIDGQGKKWWDEFYRVIVDLQKNGIKDLNKYQPLWDKENNTEELYRLTNSDYVNTLNRRFFRPPLFQTIRCENIRIEGITIMNSPFWTINPEFCENITVTGVTINNPPSPNTDGINPSSCRNVHISDCHISVGDDCITIKSGRDEQARNLAIPCENITITNCTMLSGHGGVVIGSEVSGDVRKVVISNCVFDGTDRGIRLKSTRGRGGIVEEIRVSNIVMKNIQKEAIIMNLMYSKMDPEPVSERTPVFRNIHISNLTGTEVNKAIEVVGLEEMPVSDISFSNINIQSKQGATIENAKNVTLKDIRIDTSSPFKIAHSENVMLNNVWTGTPDNEKPLITVQDSKDLIIQGCFPMAGNRSFLRLDGKNEGVVLMNNYLKRIGEVLDKQSEDKNNPVYQTQQRFENRFERPLSNVLTEISERFNVRLSYDIDTVGKVLPYADFRIRPYSIEETLTNVLAPFDYKFVKQSDHHYKLKSYEYHRRTPEDGKKMLDYLASLYPDRKAWEERKKCLYTEVREKLGIDDLLVQRVHAKPVSSKIRKYDGYTVQNFALETLPGLYVAGTIYTPLSKGKHALIICPNGHFADGRYRKDQQVRMGSLARMGAVCVGYDLFGWGESALQVGSEAHRSSAAHVIQAMNGIAILDYMLTRNDIDRERVGVNGGSGGGSQAVLLSVLDDRYTAAAPVVSLASHFDGGCPCESGLPVFLACGGTNNAELAAMFAPRPLLIVSDGGDWTASVPALEYPYLKNIYTLYDAVGNVENVHLEEEGHDFGINKRSAVYDFFISRFSLDRSKLDEGRITIEPQEALQSFGKEGELYPENAIRSFEQLQKYFR